MLSLLLSPLIIMALLWLIARHEAEISYRIIFFVVAGITLLAFALGFVSMWLSLAVYLFGLPKAILITILFIAILVGLDLLWDFLFPGPAGITA
jgi:hypothetical protein